MSKYNIKKFQTSRISIADWINADTTHCTHNHAASDKSKENDASVLTVTLNYLSNTTVADVGLQIWCGSFILIDYLLNNRDKLYDKVLMDLGCGSGLCGVVLSLLHHRGAFVTDYSTDILDLAKSNIQLNAHLQERTGSKSTVAIKQLDWFDLGIINRKHINTVKSARAPTVVLSHDISLKNQSEVNNTDTSTINQNDYNWTESDQSLLNSNEVLFLASDVIYDDVLTEAFFLQVSQLMHKGEKLWLSLEKRMNFSSSEMVVVATGYRLFMAILGLQYNPTNRGSNSVVPDGKYTTNVGKDETCHTSSCEKKQCVYSSKIKKFCGRLINMQQEAPIQYVQHQNRQECHGQLSNSHDKSDSETEVDCSYKVCDEQQQQQSHEEEESLLEMWEITCME